MIKDKISFVWISPFVIWLVLGVLWNLVFFSLTGLSKFIYIFAPFILLILLWKYNNQLMSGQRMNYQGVNKKLWLRFSFLLLILIVFTVGTQIMDELYGLDFLVSRGFSIEVVFIGLTSLLTILWGLVLTIKARNFFKQ